MCSELVKWYSTKQGFSEEFYIPNEESHDGFL